MGVKQGCVLSPLLFSLFLNDLDDALVGGIEIGTRIIKLLMYADDIVILADTADKLQRMINSLIDYCSRWNLTINLGKSEIMIFGKGMRRANAQKWNWQGTEIKVVNKYKYLGIQLTPGLTFRPHLEEKFRAARHSINMVWRNFLSKKEISLSQKFKLFDAVSRAILCYGSQIWGYQSYDIVEKLQRFFIKRIVGLPQNTPNYVLQLESGRPLLHIFTLKMHFDYILKILQYPESRHIGFLAKEVIRRKIFWAQDWINLMDTTGVHFDMSNFDKIVWGRKMMEILEKTNSRNLQTAIEKARETRQHGEYNNLQLNGPEVYFYKNLPLTEIRFIVKARAGLFNLNSRPGRVEPTDLCSLCNMYKKEDIFHFICECPILTPSRRSHFQQRTLSREELWDYLNGKDWKKLYGFLRAGLKYRGLLVAEYNS